MARTICWDWMNSYRMSVSDELDPDNSVIPPSSSTADPTSSVRTEKPTWLAY